MFKNINLEQIKQYKKIIFNGIDGCSKILINYYDGDIVYDSIKKTFYLWNYDTKLWEIIYDQEILIGEFMEISLYIFSKIIKSFKKDGLKESELEEIINALFKIKSKLEATAIYKEIIILFKKKCFDNDFSSDLDYKNKNLLPILNGLVIELNTLKTRERRKDDLFTVECPVNFLGKNFKSIYAEKFFNSLFKEDKDNIKTEYLQMLFGYCLSGEISSKLFISLLGQAGYNGKSTLFSLMKKILTSTFCSSVNKNVIFKQKNETSHESSLMSMMKIRCAYFSETDGDNILNTSLIKQITGGDPIKCREIYKKEGDEHMFLSKLIIGTNTIYSISKKDSANPDHTALMKRNHYIALKVSFIENHKKEIEKKNVHYKEADTDFINKLLKTQDGLDDFFSYLCIGCFKWYNQKDKNGKKIVMIEQPQEIIEDKEKYIGNIDKLKYFIDKFFIIKNDDEAIASEYCVKRSDFFNTYRQYCYMTGLTYDRNTTQAELETKGYEIDIKTKGTKKKYINNQYVIYGIQPKENIIDDKEDNENENKEIKHHNNLVREYINLLNNSTNKNKKDDN